MMTLRLAALALISATALAAVPTTRVVVNDRPLHIDAVVRNNRVFVPMRAIFEALGATVRYDNRTKRVDATTSDRNVALTVGTQRAPIVAGRTYVPLRFVSESLGADVRYDNVPRIVMVDTPQHEATRGSPGTSRPQIIVTQQEPQPNMRAGTAYPAIGATLHIPNGAAIASLQMLIDNVDVSQLASYEAGTILYMPRAGLGVGSHTVLISGTTNTGVPFTSQWTFETTQPPPYSGEVLPLAWRMRLDAFGGNPYYPGQWMNLQLTAPPGGRAYVFTCFTSHPWEMNSAPDSQFYSMSLQLPSDLYPNERCPLTAMYVSWNGNVTYMANPVFVWIAQRAAQPTPVPTPTQRPGTQPIGRRSPEPTPTPTPRPTPTQAPRPIPTPRPTPTPPLRRAPIEHPTTAPTAAPTARPTEKPTPHPTEHPKRPPIEHPIRVPCCR